MPKWGTQLLIDTEMLYGVQPLCLEQKSDVDIILNWILIPLEHEERGF